MLVFYWHAGGDSVQAPFIYNMFSYYDGSLFLEQNNLEGGSAFVLLRPTLLMTNNANCS